MEKSNLKKNFFWNTLGTGLNSFLSLFLLVLVTRINGIDTAGIFSFAFSIACLFYVVGIYNGRIFQVTENNDVSDKSFIITKVITCIIMLLIAIMYISIKHYSFDKSIIILLLCLLKMIEAFSEVIYGIFQKENCLYKSGISYTLKSILGLVLFLIVDIFTKNIFYSIIALLIGYVVIGLFYDFNNYIKKYKNNTRASIKDIKKILFVGFLPFLFSFLSLFLINCPKYAIDNFLNNDLQAVFGIIVMPATLVSLIAQFIIYPYINTLKTYITNNDIDELIKIIKKILLVIILIGVLCVIVAYFLGIPVLELIYNIDLVAYKNEFLIILLGATCNACIYIISNVLVSMRKLKNQIFIFSFLSIFGYFLSRYMVKSFSLLGASVSYFIIMFSGVILFILLLVAILKKKHRR